MKQIVVVNGAGFGEEVASWVRLMPGFGSEFTLKGFLDSRDLKPSLPLLGKPEEYHPEPDDALVLALSAPEQKKKWAGHFRSRNARFFSVVHPQNTIGPFFLSGEGLILAPFNSISISVQVGDFVTIYGFCKIGHDLKIGSYSHLSSHCSLDGFSSLPEESFLPSFSKIEKNHHP